jgi:hypothetical protein
VSGKGDSGINKEERRTSYHAGSSDTDEEKDMKKKYVLRPCICKMQSEWQGKNRDIFVVG